jgi:cell division protein ZapA
MTEPVSVSILDREYLISCTPEERPGLIAAASYLDSKMREIRAGARSASLERIAVLAALTVAHELLGAKQRETSEAAVLAHHLQAINAKLERALPASIQ